jgi:hypothetical protein
MAICDRCGDAYSNEAVHQRIHNAEDQALRLVDDEVEANLKRMRKPDTEGPAAP